jgi:hypothetical protein
MLGTGIGTGTRLVTGSATVSHDLLGAAVERKLSDSTLVCASMLTFKAGCGTGRRMSGPK